MPAATSQRCTAWALTPTRPASSRRLSRNHGRDARAPSPPVVPAASPPDPGGALPRPSRAYTRLVLQPSWPAISAAERPPSTYSRTMSSSLMSWRTVARLGRRGTPRGNQPVVHRLGRHPVPRRHHRNAQALIHIQPRQSRSLRTNTGRRHGHRVCQPREFDRGGLLVTIVCPLALQAWDRCGGSPIQFLQRPGHPRLNAVRGDRSIIAAFIAREWLGAGVAVQT
jgi:hypothetical protein